MSYTKWRYKKVIRYESDLVAELNTQGSEGWELVSCNPGSDPNMPGERLWVCLMKRPSETQETGWIDCDSPNNPGNV